MCLDRSASPDHPPQESADRVEHGIVSAVTRTVEITVLAVVASRPAPRDSADCRTSRFIGAPRRPEHRVCAERIEHEQPMLGVLPRSPHEDPRLHFARRSPTERHRRLRIGRSISGANPRSHVVNDDSKVHVAKGVEVAPRPATKKIDGSPAIAVALPRHRSRKFDPPRHGRGIRRREKIEVTHRFTSHVVTIRRSPGPSRPSGRCPSPRARRGCGRPRRSSSPCGRRRGRRTMAETVASADLARRSAFASVATPSASTDWRPSSVSAPCSPALRPAPARRDRDASFRS